MQPLQVGVFTNSLRIEDPLEAIATTRSLGIGVVQIGPLADEWYEGGKYRDIADCLTEHGVEASAVCVTYPGESYASMEAVRDTVGLLPEALLPERLQRTKLFADFGANLNIPVLTTHIGVMPEDPSDPGYQRLAAAVVEIAEYLGALNMRFAMETGQETGEAMKAFIETVGRDNVGVNFDPANMILYGTGDPLAALDVLRDYVFHVHCKDGTRPTATGQLGREVPLGEGEVGMKRYVDKLKEIGYSGPLVIEREAGDDRLGDIARAKELLERLAG